MTTDFDGFLHMEKVMQNAGTTLDDLKETYRVWSKTYEKVYNNNNNNNLYSTLVYLYWYI